MKLRDVLKIITFAENNRKALIAERKNLVEEFGWNNKDVKQLTKDIKEISISIQTIKQAYGID